MFDIPLSVVKTNREWDPKVHKGLWCLAQDVMVGNNRQAIVIRAAKSVEDLYVFPNCYLIDPNGKRLEN